MATKYELGELVWKITGDDSGFNKSISKTEKKAAGVGKSWKSAGKTIAKGLGIAAVAAVAFGVAVSRKLIKAASDAEETASKFGVVFSAVAKNANILAKELATSYGLSTTESKKLLANTGDLLTGFGLSGEAALDLSFKVQALSVDLASFQNLQGGAKQASDALTKGLLGERESLKTLGIVIRETDVKQALLAAGKEKLTGMARQQAVAEETLKIAFQQSKNALGDFERTQMSYENTMRRAAARTEDLAAAAGGELLPAMSRLGQAFINASADGGVIQAALMNIAKAAAIVITALSNLIIKTDEAFRKADEYNSVLGTNKRELDSLGNSLQEVNKRIGDGIKVFAGVNQLEARARMIKRIRELEEQNGKIVEKSAKKSANANDLIKKQQMDMLRMSKGRTEATKKGKAETISFEMALQKSAKTGAKTFDELSKAAGKFWKDLTIFGKMQVFNTAIQNIGSQVTDMINSISALMTQITTNRIGELDAQMEAELEAAGVLEETQVEQAQREFDAAQAQGDQVLIEEKRRALEKAKIEEKFAKKRRQLEYEGALTAWEFQVAAASIALAQAPLNAFVSTLAWAAFPGGQALAGVMAALAGATAGLQFAAVLAAKPAPPKFAQGGIVPGSSMSGDNVSILANSGEAVINQTQQRRLLDIADGSGGGGQMYRVTGDVDALWTEIFKASKDGNLFIDRRAVTDR